MTIEQKKILKSNLGLVSGAISLCVAIFLGVTWLNLPTIKIDTLNTKLDTYIINNVEKDKLKKDVHDEILKGMRKDIKANSDKNKEQDKTLILFDQLNDRRYEEITGIIRDL